MSKQDPVSDWMLERYLAGELPPAEARRIDERLQQDPALAARLQALKDSNAAILSQYPAPETSGEILRRAHRQTVADNVNRKGGRDSRIWMLAPSLAALALTVLVFLPSRQAIDPDGTREKGLKAHVLIYRQNGAGAEPLANNALAGKGDLLQVSYVAAGRSYGVIVSIDGRGSVTLHTPPEEGPAAKLEPRGEVLLPRAYELDDAPAFERFFFVSSAKPFSAKLVTEAARRLAADPASAVKANLVLPAGFEQTSVLVRKR